MNTDRQSALQAALSLPPAERASLAAEIWDSLAAEPASGAAVTLTEAQERELDRCWQAYQADPAAGDDWATVRARVEGTRTE